MDSQLLITSDDQDLRTISLVQLVITLMIMTRKESDYILYFDNISQVEKEADC